MNKQHWNHSNNHDSNEPYEGKYQLSPQLPPHWFWKWPGPLPQDKRVGLDGSGNSHKIDSGMPPALSVQVSSIVLIWSPLEKILLWFQLNITPQSHSVTTYCLMAQQKVAVLESLIPLAVKSSSFQCTVKFDYEYLNVSSSYNTLSFARNINNRKDVSVLVMVPDLWWWSKWETSPIFEV